MSKADVPGKLAGALDELLRISRSDDMELLPEMVRQVGIATRAWEAWEGDGHVVSAVNFQGDGFIGFRWECTCGAKAAVEDDWLNAAAAAAAGLEHVKAARG